jgi:predicted patatin/cPLA2 family phospholipase
MKHGLILEGGALRGLYSAGILDVMMEEGIVQGREAKTFIKNSALVKHLISNYTPWQSDLWAFTDSYFDKLVEQGHIIPIDDLREADELCEKFNLTMEPVM